MYVDKEHLMLDEICLEPRLVGILEKVLFLAKDYDFKFKKQTLQKIDLTIRTTAGLYLIEYDDDGTVAMEKLLMDADLFRTYIRQDVREMLWVHDLFSTMKIVNGVYVPVDNQDFVQSYLEKRVRHFEDF